MKNALFVSYFQTFSANISHILKPHSIRIIMSNDNIVCICGSSKKRPASVSADKAIKLENSFAAHASTNEGNPINDARTTPVPSTSGAERAPPAARKQYQLFFEIGKNCKQHIEPLHSLSKEISTDVGRNTIKTTTESADAFRAAQNYLVSNKIPTRVMDLKSAKPVKIIARGLPFFTNVSDIEEILRSNNIEVIKIAYLTNRKTKQPMPLFLATLKSSPAVENVHNIKTINYLAVKFETYKAKGVAQCYRCQQFGYSSLNSQLTP